MCESMLLKELAIEDVKKYRNCMRMSPASFEILLEKISLGNLPEQKFEITLSYLATG